MNVIVKIPAYMSSLAKTDQVIITLDEKACLSDLLIALTKKYGKRFIDLLHTSELGQTPIWASVTIDGKDLLIDGLAKSKLKLKDGVVITLLGPVGGG